MNVCHLGVELVQIIASMRRAVDNKETGSVTSQMRANSAPQSAEICKKVAYAIWRLSIVSNCFLLSQWYGLDSLKFFPPSSPPAVFSWHACAICKGQCRLFRWLDSESSIVFSWYYHNCLYYIGCEWNLCSIKCNLVTMNHVDTYWSI